MIIEFSTYTFSCTPDSSDGNHQVQDTSASQLNDDDALFQSNVTVHQRDIQLRQS